MVDIILYTIYAFRINSHGGPDGHYNQGCHFFKEHSFLVCLSIDGPRPMHDVYRQDKGGAPTFEKVIRGLSLLEKYRVDWNALTTINHANAGRPLVLAAHHPLASSSEHGGKFSLRQHLFPLTELAPWAWLPLRGVGSLYPAYRSLGFETQDLSSGIYTAYRELMDRASAIILRSSSRPVTSTPSRSWRACRGWW